MSKWRITKDGSTIIGGFETLQAAMDFAEVSQLGAVSFLSETERVNLVVNGKPPAEDKPPLALIPRAALEAEARVFGFGASKYSMHDWRKGLSVMDNLNALHRHLTKVISGEDYDSESGLPHMAHIRVRAAFHIQFLEDGIGTDDRYKEKK